MCVNVCLTMLTSCHRMGRQCPQRCQRLPSVHYCLTTFTACHHLTCDNVHCAFLIVLLCSLRVTVKLSLSLLVNVSWHYFLLVVKCFRMSLVAKLHIWCPPHVATVTQVTVDTRLYPSVTSEPSDWSRQL